MSLRIAALKPTTLKSSLSASASSVILSSLVDRHDAAVTLATFGEWGTIVIKSGDQWECIKFNGLTNNSDGSVTLTVATNGRKILPVSPYTGGSTGFDFIAGSDVIVTNDGLIMSTFGNTENAQTWNEIQTFVQPPVLPDPVANTDGANKEYVDGVAVAGASNANTTTKGIVEEATQAEADAGTATGGTGAKLFTPQDKVRARNINAYVADSGAADAYVITPSPAITAYAAGQVFVFKATNANTGASTVNVNALGTKTIKKDGGANDLAAGDIVASQIVQVVYDGTNFQLLSPVGGGVPIGTIQMYGGASAPAGWVLCDGSSLLRSGTYAALFAILSTTYGSPDGTHFNVPDMRGRIPVGVGTGTGGGSSGTGLPSGGSALTAVARGTWKGEETHTLTTPEIPAHTHSYTAPNLTQAGTGGGAVISTSTSGTTGSTGGDGAHNNIQPVMGLNFLIKF